VKEKEDWQKYLSCNPKPDVFQEAEVTTYLTNYTESNRIKTLSIQGVIEDFQYTEGLIHDLNQVLMRAYADADTAKVEWCENYIQRLRDVSYRKLDEATAHMAKNADLFIEEEAMNQQPKDQKDGGQVKTYKSGDTNTQKIEINKFHAYADVKYGIWVNPNEKVSNRQRHIDFGDKNIQVDIPRPMLNKKVIIRVVWTSFDAYSGKEYNKDFIVGGVLDIALFDFLNLPKRAKSWVLKYDYDTTEAVKKIQYPSPDSTGPLSYQNASPVKVLYTLPSNIYLTPNDTLRVAAWDPKTGWTSDNIDEIKYDFEKKLLTFSSLRLAPLALVQDRCTDYPYASWELRCIEEQKAILDIKGKRQNLRFEIGPSYVMLKNRNEPELSHIVNKKFAPGVLLRELYRCGINLLPVDKDAEASNIPSKSLEAELKAIYEIGFAVRLFYIKSSKWNMALSQDKILVRMRENLEFDEEFAEDQEKDWKSVVFGPNKCSVIKARDSSETLDESMLDNTETHANLELLLKKHELTNEEWLFRLRETEFIGFIDTIKRFFRLTHLLTFTLG